MLHPKGKSEAPRPQGGASRARSGEQNASQRNLIFPCAPRPIVLLDPAYKAGFAGYLPVKAWPCDHHFLFITQATSSRLPHYRNLAVPRSLYIGSPTIRFG